MDWLIGGLGSGEPCHPLTETAPCLPVSLSGIPRRVLRGFRAGTGQRAYKPAPGKVMGFNTPEGVEGFSSVHPVYATFLALRNAVSIPRRVLRGFREGKFHH